MHGLVRLTTRFPRHPVHLAAGMLQLPSRATGGSTQSSPFAMGLNAVLVRVVSTLLLVGLQQAVSEPLGKVRLTTNNVKSYRSLGECLLPPGSLVYKVDFICKLLSHSL